MSWLQVKIKNCRFGVSSSHSMQRKWIISWSDCDIWWKADFIWQQAMTSSLAGLRRNSKALPEAKYTPKQNVMITVWWSAVSPINYGFLNPGETITSEKYALQIDETHQKLQCLQPALVNRKDRTTMPDCMSHNQCFRSAMEWVRFCLIYHINLTSCQLTTTSSSITTVCQENTSTTIMGQKMLSKISLNPAQMFIL